MVAAISCLIVLLACATARVSGGVAVMSIDFGSQFMKVAIVKPGVPMEIALNRESNRKTPSAIFMRRDERSFANAALMSGIRYPKNLYQFFIPLLGKPIDHPAVREFRAKYPYYDIVAHPETGTVVFQHDATTQYSVEELTAMLLENAKDTAESFTEMTVNDAIVTIPAYWGQAERRALVRAANMSNLNIIQIMPTTTAVALHFGVFRRSQFNSTRRTFMFFDVGASSSIATVVSYETVQQSAEAGGLRETVPQLTVHGVAYDRTVGTRSFIMRLRDMLVDRFQKQGRTTKQLRDEPKVLAKVYAEAEQVFQVLSANTEFTAQIEGLIDEQDYSSKVTRDDLYAACGDLFERAVAPLHRALAAANLGSFEQVEEIVLFGGGSRVPRVQELAMAASGHSELGRSVNTDEAAALGSVYHAAFLSKAFRVKPFPVREVSPYAIQVEFDRVRADVDDTEAAARKDGQTPSPTMKRVLFQRMNVVPQKRVLTFAKHTQDFEFFVNYAELPKVDGSLAVDDPELEREHIGLNISRVEVVGLTQVTAKYAAEGTASYKGVKAHFRLDESGVLDLTGLEALFEKQITVEENATKSTFERIGDAFSSLFGSNEAAGGAEAGAEGQGEQQQQQQQQKKDAEGAEPTPAQTGNAEQPKAATEGAENNDTAKAAETVEKKLVTKTVTVNELLSSRVHFIDTPELSAASRAKSRQVIVELRSRDDEKAAREKARNDLESFAINVREHLLNEPAYEKATTEAERESILGEVQKASDWLYEDADDTTPTTTFEARLAELKALVKDLYARVRDAEDRPRAFAALADMLNRTETFLVTVHNLTETYKNLDPESKEATGPFTKSEITNFEDLISETKQWYSATQEKLRTMDLTVKPTITSEDINRRVEKLDREVKYLLTRARLFRPPVPKKSAKSETSNETEKPTSSDQKSSSESQQEQEGLDLEFPESEEETEARKQAESKSKEQEEQDTLQLDGDTQQHHAEL